MTPYSDYEYVPQAPVNPPPRPARRWGGPAATGAGLLLLLLSKLKYLLVLLKFGKVGGTALTMLVSVVAYGALFGWPYAAGFVALLFVHEMGHVMVARWQGVKVTAPTFIPFLGAFITMRGRPGDSLGEAAIAAGGPVLGSFGALGCLGLYQLTHQPLMLALAYVGFFLNLFNLIPMSPLDGGRIVGAASRWATLAGLPVLAVLAFLRPNPFLFFILVLGAFDAWGRFRAGNSLAGYYSSVPPWARVGVALGYLSLVIVLALAMNETHAALPLAR